jgi:hypothetical protein
MNLESTTMRTVVPRSGLGRPASLAGAIAVLLSIAAAPAASADGNVTCTVIEIEASTADAPSMDGALAPLEKKLRKPPFSSWNSFKQLGSQALTLEPMKPGTTGLVHGKATLLLRELTTDGGKKPRVSLGVTLDDAAGKRVLDSKVAVDAGDYLVVGRSLPAGKGQLVALNCR